MRLMHSSESCIWENATILVKMSTRLNCILLMSTFEWRKLALRQWFLKYWHLRILNPHWMMTESSIKFLRHNMMTTTTSKAKIQHSWMKNHNASKIETTLIFRLSCQETLGKIDLYIFAPNMHLHYMQHFTSIQHENEHRVNYRNFISHQNII